VGQASLPVNDVHARATAQMAELLYRRKLPHWRQNQVTYFVTWRLGRGQQQLYAEERDLVEAAMKRFDGQRYAAAGLGQIECTPHDAQVRN